MRHILLAALCTAALLTGIARQASAKCAGPSIAFAPADGSHVEPGVTWVFIPGYLGDKTVEITVRSDGETLPATITQVSRNETFTTYRVAVDGTPGAGSLERLRYTVDAEVQYDDWKSRGSASYQTGTHQTPDHDVATPPAAEPVLLLDPSYHHSQWSCSYTDKVTATPSQHAPAYRIEWARSEDAYRRGIRSTVVVPWSMKVFWLSSERINAEPPGAELQLGHVSCFGETIPAEALARTVYLGIVPLRGDADVAAPADPIAVRSGDPLRVEYLGLVEPVVAESPNADDDTADRYICGYARARMAERDAPTLPFGVPFGVLFAALGLLAGIGLGGRVSRTLSEATVTRLDSWSLPQLALVTGLIAALLPFPAAGLSPALWAAAPLGVLGAAVATIAFRVIRDRVR